MNDVPTAPCILLSILDTTGDGTRSVTRGDECAREIPDIQWQVEDHVELLHTGRFGSIPRNEAKESTRRALRVANASKH